MQNVYFTKRTGAQLLSPLSLTLIVLLLCQCTPQLSERYAQPADLVFRQKNVPVQGERSFQINPCYVNEHYIPDTNHLDHSPVKYIRVNIHWVNAADSSKNLNGQEAIEFTKGWLHTANKDLETNNKLWFPYKNNIPVIPTRYRYVLTPDPEQPEGEGIYFHYDDELCYYIHKGKDRNLFDRRVIQKYRVGEDSILNIFVMPHHPDSVASSTYLAGSVGVALGNHIKIAGIVENGGPYWQYRGVLNHEVGHVFGLVHAWVGNDGCEDTPPHKGECWTRTKEPPCDTMATNNVMDYNALQNAWTPCQIGRVHRSMSSAGTRPRKLLIPRWCALDDSKTITIKDSIVWQSAKDLEGHLIIENGGVLTTDCRLSLPPGGKLIIKPGGLLNLGSNARLHNDCGQQWDGIIIQELGAKKGKITRMEGARIENAVHALPDNKNLE